MGKVYTTSEDLTSIANAIRAKSGSNSSLVYPTGFISEIGNITTGNVTVEKNDVNFIDYDGTILYSYSAADFLNLAAMPPNPSHEGLTSQGWNWTLAQAKEQVSSLGKINIGQMYITTSGKTEIDIVLNSSDFLSPQLAISLNGSLEIDWGDNSSLDTVEHTGSYSITSNIHTYATTGSYTIKLSVNTGTIKFTKINSTVDTAPMVLIDPTLSNNLIYTHAIKAIRIGNNVEIGDYAFNQCCDMQFITLPTYITQIGSYAFRGCGSLQSITFPSAIDNISTYILHACINLTEISMPYGVTTIQDCAFYYCHNLRSLILSLNITTIGSSICYDCIKLEKVIFSNLTTVSYSFYNCTNLGQVTIPASVTTISASAFGKCYNLTRIHILAISPPTISTTTFLSSSSFQGIIYVPYSSDHSILAAYQANSVWSKYTNFLQEEPQ